MALCIFETLARRAKTAEPIEVPFAGRTRVCSKNRVYMQMGPPITPGEEQFLKDIQYVVISTVETYKIRCSRNFRMGLNDIGYIKVKKVKCPLVSIVAHTDYATPGSCAHLRFHGLEPAVGLRPVLWTVDHTTSITCRYLPSRRTSPPWAGTHFHVPLRVGG